jgi:hypothetical protein
MNTIEVWQRGAYGEIRLYALSSETQEQVRLLVAAAGSASKIDEHGSWNFGIDSDKKGRVEALNWDLYGLGNDVHTGKFLIVIQIRQFNRRKEGYFPQIRKNYFLVGCNEDNSTFAHSVPSAVIHSAIRRGVDVIGAVQDWIFGCDYAKVLRQGDLALLPCAKRPSAPRIARRTATVEKSHALKANVLRQSGEGAEVQLFAKNPHLVHLPGTHPEVQGEDRWYKVMIGQRADFWRFAAPTVD